MKHYFDIIKKLVMFSTTSDLENSEEESIWVKDLSSFSDRLLPEHEDIYILGHQVTKEFPMHSHGYFEIIYVLKGQILNRVDNTEMYMTEGDFCFLNMQAKHQPISNDNEAVILNLCLSQAVFEGSLRGFYLNDNPIANFLRGEMSSLQNFIYYSTSFNQEIRKIMANIITEYRRAKFRQNYALDAHITLLLHSLTQLEEYSFYGINQNTLEILQYIEEHCIHSNMSQIAKDLGYHPSYFSAYIKKHTGHNYKDLVSHVKIRKAAELLSTTDHSIEDIARECGYQSASHFYKVFKQYYQMTPKKYRD